MSRRRFLAGSAALGALALGGPYTRILAQPKLPRDPFTLGIASGYPHPGGVTLWTRLAPEPHAGGGMPPQPVDVQWEVAADESLRQVVARGNAVASPAWAHAVHVDVTGLEPARTYWYRFRAGGAASPTGRTRTAPAADAPSQRVRFAFAACQQYEHGYYAGYRHMAAEELDLVFHLGDYIYEATWGRNLVRNHDAGEAYTLIDYRNRYALYKSDADLISAHAAFPWLVTWDDHEVDNDYANDRSQDLDAREVFLERRAAAYQAFYEHMPLPAWARPRGPDMQLYAAASYGSLASFFVLDTRQYRSHQVCPPPGRGGSTVVREEACPERLEHGLTMLGKKQEQWLSDGLGRSAARWNVIAQQTLMAQVDRRPGPGADYWTDGWDGYPRARERVLSSIVSQRVSNPLVLSGDVHMSAVADLKTDFDKAEAPAIATEFVCPSITSYGPAQKRVELFMQENPHVKFANGPRKGYTTVELTPERCVSRIRTLNNVQERESGIRTLVSYSVESGKPGAVKS